MAIFREQVGISMALRGWLCSTPALVINLPTVEDIVDFCTCDFVCDYIEQAYVYPSDMSDTYKNDYKSFLINLKDDSSTYEFTLIRPDGNETVFSDDNFGELFDKGFNQEQPLKVGYRIDWIKVFELFGRGIYQIKVSQTDFGNTVTAESIKFNVQVYDEIRADKTVKIETVQDSPILNGEDFGGMEWVNMARVEGTFNTETPNYEIDRLVDSQRNEIDIQTTKFNTYTLETNIIPNKIGDYLTEEVCMTNNVFISVNDVFNYRQYRRLPVVFEGDVSPGDDYSMNYKKKFNISFKDLTNKVYRKFV